MSSLGVTQDSASLVRTIVMPHTIRGLRVWLPSRDEGCGESQRTVARWPYRTAKNQCRFL